ncbi:flavin monoamine oxidase family protein [Paraburkholderia sabiae]|nr:NAD(P)/FAD-dependent oxidoreductase [Paraburkholderia sabiae]WJZ77335.1 NAD(P)/FAD-dependent oxidoreductase [Paraburkholderia sabiae]
MNLGHTMPMSRRSLLAAGALLLPARSFGRASPTQALAPEGETVDVVVIGAGAAGLAAARTLADAGRSVIVLEARERIGGRMFTDTRSMSRPIELGAELIHGTAGTNSLWSIVRSKKIRTARLTTTVVRLAGKSTFVDSHDAALYAFPKGRPPRPASFRPASRNETAEAYLTRLGLLPDNRPLALFYETLDGDNFPNMAASGIEPVVRALWTDPVAITQDDDADYRVPDGYVQVLRPLAEGLRIVLETVVTRIEDRGKAVVVRARSGADTLSVSARHCVVAVPASVLLHGDIEFSPPLPASRIDALKAGEMLPVAKLVMEFNRPVLPGGADGVADFSRNPSYYWNASKGARAFNGQIVVGWATGEPARELLAMPESARFGTMLAAVRSIAGQADLGFSAARMHDWTRDPYAAGAYGAWPDGNAVLKRTGRIHWVGTIMSTVDTACDSGRAAAHQILAR